MPGESLSSCQVVHANTVQISEILFVKNAYKIILIDITVIFMVYADGMRNFPEACQKRFGIFKNRHGTPVRTSPCVVGRGAMIKKESLPLENIHQTSLESRVLL